MSSKTAAAVRGEAVREMVVLASLVVLATYPTAVRACIAVTFPDGGWSHVRVPMKKAPRPRPEDLDMSRSLARIGRLVDDHFIGADRAGIVVTLAADHPGPYFPVLFDAAPPPPCEPP